MFEKIIVQEWDSDESWNTIKVKMEEAYATNPVLIQCKNNEMQCESSPVNKLEKSHTDEENHQFKKELNELETRIDMISRRYHVK